MEYIGSYDTRLHGWSLPESSLGVVMAICSVKQVMQTNNLLGTHTFVGYTRDIRLVVMWWTNIDILYTLEYLLIIKYVIFVFFHDEILFPLFKGLT